MLPDQGINRGIPKSNPVRPPTLSIVKDAMSERSPFVTVSVHPRFYTHQTHRLAAVESQCRVGTGVAHAPSATRPLKSKTAAARFIHWFPPITRVAPRPC